MFSPFQLLPTHIPQPSDICARSALLPAHIPRHSGILAHKDYVLPSLPSARHIHTASVLSVEVAPLSFPDHVLCAQEIGYQASGIIIRFVTPARVYRAIKFLGAYDTAATSSRCS